ncbi:glycine zipper 2TM domain-containing protein [Vogesella sp. GCM10023246]|uniref:Glycine zipper 2TM domain-containing protein n=1 Tax=Vogesella oryzagri TaxID=3160864 RepID=A0ABV1M7T8_9NEIS
MKTMQRLTLGAVSVAILLSLGGCAGMSRQGQNTAVGAGVGAVGGAVLTGGSVLGTVGGAAIGGVIGHEMGDRH